MLVRTLIHERAPEHLRGRAYAAYNGLRNGAEIVALTCGGVLIATAGARWTLLLAGGLPVLVALAALVAATGGGARGVAGLGHVTLGGAPASGLRRAGVRAVAEDLLEPAGDRRPREAVERSLFGERRAPRPLGRVGSTASTSASVSAARSSTPNSQPVSPSSMM